MPEMPAKPEIHFFVGKGGVGKSTVSALAAMHMSRCGLKTLLVSMDPAHNQRDLFESDFCEKPRKVSKTLSVKEVDAGFWADRYLSETQAQIRRTYVYESAFNLQKHFKVLRHSPGLEEYALLMAFEDILARGKGLHSIVFDMAPTALSLRFFSLPQISLTWLEELLTLRRLICQKKEIVSNIHSDGPARRKDRVEQTIGTLISRHTRLQQCFTDGGTHVHMVMNPDRLSFSEAVRIRQRLAGAGIEIDRVAVNKVKTDKGLAEIQRIFGPDRLSLLPTAVGELVGRQPLEAYVQLQGTTFDDFLPSTMPRSRADSCRNSSRS